MTMYVHEYRHIMQLYILYDCVQRCEAKFGAFLRQKRVFIIIMISKLLRTCKA